MLRRCAVYTRKSSEEGLEQSFNSLHAQREACEAFIKSQASEGWRLVRTHYDDGGLSGASMERPALQRLLEHIRQGLVEVVVVYKVDRLTRSLADFARIVELFDAQQVSFVAVTQQFNTTTSMGRLTLNVLLSFAQFEREVTGERIRDKIAASKQKGMWMGGTVPLGYDVRDHHLVVNAKEAETVRLVFHLYSELKSVPLVKEELERRRVVSKRRVSKAGAQSGGGSFFRGALYQILGNPIYVGEIRHKRMTHPGQHEPIVDRKTWERVQEMLKNRAGRQRGSSGQKSQGLLVGKLFDENGDRLYACWTKKGERHYRYFVSRRLVRGAAKADDLGWRLPAEEIEKAVTTAARRMLSDRRALASTFSERGLAAAELKYMLEAVARKVSSAQGNEVFGEASASIARVDLKRDAMLLALDLTALVPEELISVLGSGVRMTHLVPMKLKRKGVETRLVIPGEAATTSRSDPALLRAVARSYQWFSELACGKEISTRRIAIREKVDDSFIRRLVPLGLLAPSVIESICTGKQPASLSAERLKYHRNLPIDWNAQERLLAE
jgi:DNA invertase Pin-like site-specific DNA recombinase